jgi:hypothetical protein
MRTKLETGLPVHADAATQRTRLEPGDLVHAGAGTTLVLTYLGLIPGVIPLLVLAGVVAAVLVLPFVVLGLAAAILAAPPYGLWWLVTRTRRGRRPEPPGVQPSPTPPAVQPSPVPSPHAC